MRVLAVRRVIEDGERPREVMDSLGLCRTSIYPWLRRYRDQGLEALAEKISQGPEPKLSEKQRQQVRRWILGKDPRQHGFDFGLWTRRIVQTLILEKMGVELGLSLIHISGGAASDRGWGEAEGGDGFPGTLSDQHLSLAAKI